MIDREKGEIHFAPGDWIVHDNHGVGRVTAIEDKRIGSKETSYYRVETDQTTMWVPVEKHTLLRPVISSDDLQQIVAILKRPSRQMSPVFQSRMVRIRQAEAKGTPQALARVVRDLWARQKRRGSLSNTEGQALRDMTDQLLAEWSVCVQKEKSQIRKKLYSLLRQNSLTAVN